MAPTLATRAATLSLLLLLAIAISLEAKTLKKLKETKMVFYMSDWETGLNVTTVPVAGIRNKEWGIVNFGTIFVIDDKLTEEYDRNSTQVGRAQGCYVNSALDGTDVHLLLSLVFTNEKYNGSTLEIQGADRLFIKYRDVSVVGGTGVFKFGRGYATLETVFLDLKALNAIIRWNLTVLHY